jgi:hypothetical protein
MIRIAITPAAFDAVAATLRVGSVAFEPHLNEKGERLIWVEAFAVDRLRLCAGPARVTATVILRNWKPDQR